MESAHEFQKVMQEVTWRSTRGWAGPNILLSAVDIGSYICGLGCHTVQAELEDGSPS